MGEKLGPLFQLYYRPSRALSTILDSGSLGLAVMAAFLASFGLERSLRDGLTGLGLLAVVFVPACIAMITVWEHLGSVSVVLRRDYSPLLVCTLMCWGAAALPGVIAVFFMPAFALWITLAVILYFLALASTAIRTVFGAGIGTAIGTVSGGLIAAVAGYFAYETFGGMASYFASPLVLIWLYILFRPNLDMFAGLGGGLRSRQNFRRHLDALTVNPRDADAHYQLGLIYQQRRNFAEAIPRFTKAVEIDPGEADAHYQLGVIALEQKRYQDARRHFAATLALNDKHASSEAWRGLGTADFQVGKTEQALAELQKYTDRREFDPEGQYWLGETFKKLGRIPEARAAFQLAVEGARTAPSHRRRYTSAWGRQANAELRTLD
jgi:hypothetical protein